MKAPRMTASIVVLFGCILAIGFLWVSKMLTPIYLFLFGGIAMLALLRYGGERKLMDFDEIRARIFTKATELQDTGDLPAGTVRLMPETELKELEIHSKSPTIEPDKWYVGVVIDTSPKEAFLFKASIYGTILGFSKIKTPSDWSVRDIPERTKVGAVPKPLDEYEEFKEKQKEKEAQEK